MLALLSFLTVLSVPALAGDFPLNELTESCKADLPKRMGSKLTAAQVQAACDCLFREMPEAERNKFSGEEWLAVAKGIQGGRVEPKKPLPSMTKEERKRHQGVAAFAGFYLMAFEKPEVKKCTEASAGK